MPRSPGSSAKPAACRQIVHRAKQRVQDERPRFSVSREAHGQLLEKFIEAANSGRREEILRLLADDVRVTTDGGGKVSSFRKVLQGADRVARLRRAQSYLPGDPCIAWQTSTANRDCCAMSMDNWNPRRHLSCTASARSTSCAIPTS